MSKECEPTHCLVRLHDTNALEICSMEEIKSKDKVGNYTVSANSAILKKAVNGRSRTLRYGQEGSAVTVVRTGDSMKDLLPALRSKKRIPKLKRFSTSPVLPARRTVRQKRAREKTLNKSNLKVSRVAERNVKEKSFKIAVDLNMDKDKTNTCTGLQDSKVNHCDEADEEMSKTGSKRKKIRSLKRNVRCSGTVEKSVATAPKLSTKCEKKKKKKKSLISTPPERILNTSKAETRNVDNGDHDGGALHATHDDSDYDEENMKQYKNVLVDIIDYDKKFPPLDFAGNSPDKTTDGKVNRMIVASDEDSDESVHERRDRTKKKNMKNVIVDDSSDSEIEKTTAVKSVGRRSKEIPRENTIDACERPRIFNVEEGVILKRKLLYDEKAENKYREFELDISHHDFDERNEKIKKNKNSLDGIVDCGAEFPALDFHLNSPYTNEDRQETVTKGDDSEESMHQQEESTEKKTIDSCQRPNIWGVEDDIFSMIAASGSGIAAIENNNTKDAPRGSIKYPNTKQQVAPRKNGDACDDSEYRRKYDALKTDYEKLQKELRSNKKNPFEPDSVEGQIVLGVCQVIREELQPFRGTFDPNDIEKLADRLAEVLPGKKFSYGALGGILSNKSMKKRCNRLMDQYWTKDDLGRLYLRKQKKQNALYVTADDIENITGILREIDKIAPLNKEDNRNWEAQVRPWISLKLKWYRDDRKPNEKKQGATVRQKKASMVHRGKGNMREGKILKQNQVDVREDAVTSSSDE